MAEYTCNKAWLMCPSPEGVNTPLFMQVRSNDVHWETYPSPDYVNPDEMVLEPQNPQYWTGIINEWNVKVNADGTYQAKKQIPLSTLTISEDVSYLDIPVELPLATKDDLDFFPQFTLRSDSACGKHSFVSFFNLHDENQIITDFVIHIENQNESEKFYTGMLENTILYISLEGRGV